MTPDRFSECLLHIRWTLINIASAPQCELSWIEGAGGRERGSSGPNLLRGLETLAKAHEALPAPADFTVAGVQSTE